MTIQERRQHNIKVAFNYLKAQKEKYYDDIVVQISLNEIFENCSGLLGDYYYPSICIEDLVDYCRQNGYYTTSSFCPYTDRGVETYIILSR
jgi:hypothetical protein